MVNVTSKIDSNRISWGDDLVKQFFTKAQNR